MQKLSAALPLFRTAFFEPQSIPELLETVRTIFQQTVSCEEVQLYLKDGDAFLAMTKHQAKRIAGLGGLAEEVFSSQVPVLANDAEADPRLLFAGDQSLRSGVKNSLSVPIVGNKKKTLGVVEFVNAPKSFLDEDRESALFVASLVGIAIEQFQGIDFLRNLNLALQTQASAGTEGTQDYLESRNPQLLYLRDRIRNYAEAEAAALIEGESGTGKEGVARLLHNLSKRASGPFVIVNCAAIPETLFEAELFGATKGAATGVSARKGKIELAHKGTLVLDEIGELPLSLQPKLLRALQEKRITPLGSDAEPKAIDFRLVCSTNRHLTDLVEKGTFREDLFFRLNVITINLPPLRERSDDISALGRSILGQLCQQYRLPPKAISQQAIDYLKAQPWPGNIRQLRNRIESALINAREREEIGLADFSEKAFFTGTKTRSDVAGPRQTLKEAKDQAEQRAVQAALLSTKGNKAAAAKLLGITREGLRKVLLKQRPSSGSSGESR
jgi:Nif-specific regulatory protein